MTRKFLFLTHEDALVFTAKVNTRREALGHYGRALVRTDITDEEVAFLARSCRKLSGEIQRLMA